jgi:UDP-sulfoquinovose synthase
VFNQFTEVFSVSQLAQIVRDAAAKLGYTTEVDHVENPRIEAEEHFYEPRNEHLLALGLQPRLLSDELVESMLLRIASSAENIDQATILPRVRWRENAPTPAR